MKITLLGTGTPTPSLRRMSSGYMVEIGDDVILLDKRYEDEGTVAVKPRSPRKRRLDPYSENILG